MKRLSKLWAENPNFWGNGRTKTVLPFPGSSPTRWRVFFVHKGGRRAINYITKPSYLAMQQIKKMQYNLAGTLYLFEFDQLGVVQLAQTACPYPMQLNAYIRTLAFNFYYPWSVSLAFWSKSYVKQLQHGKRTFFIYSPLKEMTSDDAKIKLEAYRIWLAKTKPWK